jgi:hypothetical protein
MSRAEKFISDYTMNCSNELAFENKDGSKLYHAWLTSDDAKSAVEIAREEVIDKTIEWIGEIYNYHYIMRYSDCCEPPISELTEWFKNYIKNGKENEVQERKSK